MNLDVRVNKEVLDNAEDPSVRLPGLFTVTCDQGTLVYLVRHLKKDADNLDLLVYFAAALVALILMERILQAMEG